MRPRVQGDLARSDRVTLVAALTLDGGVGGGGRWRRRLVPDGAPQMPPQPTPQCEGHTTKATQLLTSTWPIPLDPPGCTEPFCSPAGALDPATIGRGSRSR